MSESIKYNYGSVLGSRSIQTCIASYLPLKRLFSSFVTCSSVWNQNWQTPAFQAAIKSNFNNEYGKQTLSILGHEWPLNSNNDDNKIGNSKINCYEGDYIIVESLANDIPIPIHCDIKPVEAIAGLDIKNNKDMVKYMLTNWIYVNKNNTECPGGVECGSIFIDIYIDLLRSTCNANFVSAWASRVCMYFIVV